MVRLLFAVALFCTPGRAARARVQVEAQAKSKESAGTANNCADILKDGIRNQVQHDLKTYDQYEAEEMLKQFDESYSYDDYKRDHRNAQASSSSQSSETGVSVSYGLFSASGSHGQSSSDAQMSEAEFNARKTRITQQKHALETSSSSSGASSENLNYAAHTVSAEISSAWKDCMKFAQSQIETFINKEITGTAVNIGLKHSLGQGPEPRIPPMVVKVEATPADSATCEVTNGEGQTLKKLPIEFHVGIPVHISCHRTENNTDKASIYIATNVVKEGMRIYFNDVVTHKIAEDLADLEQEVDRKLLNIEKKIKQTQKTVMGEIQVTNNSIASVDSRLLAATSSVESVSSQIKAAQSNIKQIKAKLLSGVCRLCYTCGGNHNNHMGTFPKAKYSQYGSSCAGNRQDMEDNPRICCLSAM